MHLFFALFITCFLTSCVTVRGTGSNDILLPSTRNDIDDLWNAINVQQQKLAEQSQIISTQQVTIDSLPKFCQGRTSYTEWQPYLPYGVGIHVSVNTSHCQFKQTPSYFTSLSGTQHHYIATGMTSIYGDSVTGFTVFIYPDPIHTAETSQKTLGLMPVRKWELNWIGIEKKD